MQKPYDFFEKFERVIITFEHDDYLPREMQMVKKPNGYKIFKYKMNFASGLGKNPTKPHLFRYYIYA